jgi:DNA-nicking Smr family endonuclease
MTEEEKKQQQQEAAAEPQAAPERPNRDRYSKMFGEDYPDIDFEDKEARYGAMANDREELRSLRNSGRKLGAAFDKHRWLAAMFADLAENEDLNPITWMAQNGIDIAAALEDEAIAKEVSDKIAEFQENQAKSEEIERERAENLQTSAKNLQSLQEKYGMDNDATLELWNDAFENIFDPLLRGEVTPETWEMIIKGKNYDTDLSGAREQGAMQARNEKIQNKMTKAKTEVPPTLSQGGGQKASAQPKRESFWDDMQGYH